MESLLPPNSSKLERNLEKVTERASNIDARFASLWDPWECPKPVLPWLAWAVGVKEWSLSWPESRQRSVIASSMDIRRSAGTVAAIRRAVESLEIQSIEYREWHEYNGQPGTYRINATLEDRGMTQEQYEELVRVLESAGRLSAWMDPAGFTLVGRGKFYSASTTSSGQITTVRPRLTTQTTQNHSVLSGSAIHSSIAVSLRPDLTTQVAQIQRILSGWALRATAFITVYPA